MPQEAKLQKRSDLQTVIAEDYEFNLSDFALFMSVMKVKEAYEDVLSIILDEADLQLKKVKAEQVVLNKSGKRAIRLDAWALDVRERQFDMEMQNDTQGDDVRRRSRFYQSMIDTPILKSGKKLVTNYHCQCRVCEAHLVSERARFFHHTGRYFWKRSGNVYIQRTMRRSTGAVVGRWYKQNIPKYDQHERTSGTYQSATVHEAYHTG